jgi:hypothetical protein
MLAVYPEPVRRAAISALEAGASVSSVSRDLGVARCTVRAWAALGPAVDACFRCEGLLPARARAYSALLGYYLGDGCLSSHRGKWVLRVSCDRTLPGIVADVSRQVGAIRPEGNVWHVKGPGVVVVQSNWRHWPCLFPQHGPGRKHERQIALEDWQADVVRAFPADFLRGLFHSDGCRVSNWATRTVAGERKRYDYARWQFVNASEDILGLCTWALDLAGVEWRRSAPRVVSVSRREAVARLDGLIGPKT